MKSHLYHLQLNIDFQNLTFYKELMNVLGWSVIFEADYVIGFQSGQPGSIWFAKAENKDVANYDNRGLNHVAIQVDKQEDVDTVVEFLTQNNIQPLFETPRHRPEFAMNETETYYQVMFSTVDNLLFEVVFVGKK